MFGGKEQKEILQYVGGPIFVYIVLLLILFIGIGNVFQGVFSPYRDTETVVINETTGQVQTRTTGGEGIRTIFHPRVLGAVIILVIAAIAVRQITEVTIKEK